jgi:anaerobic magnesium-protoporphyrin IX monomethyl ester cyclase
VARPLLPLSKVKQLDILLSYISNQTALAGESVGLYSLAASLERAGFAVRVFCGRPEGLLLHLAGENPAILGFYCDYNNLPLVIRLSQRLAQQAGANGLTMIAGGPQTIGMGEAFLRESGCTFILRGEGEYTLPMLAGCLLRGQSGLANIRGLCYLDQGSYRENAAAEQIKDLDDLPLPAYHLSLEPSPVIGSSVFTGRGCPYACAYCAKPLGFGVRLRSIDSVLAEIRRNLAANPQISCLTINDDTFILSRERIQAFCAGMREIRRSRDIIWYCECHVGGMSQWWDLLPEMVEAGLVRLQVGIESGDRHVLNLYNKHITPELLEEFMARAFQAGLPQIVGNIIIGGPRETAGATLGLIRRLLYAAPGVLDLSTSFLRAYPGTRISEHPEAFGLRILTDAHRMTADDYPSVAPEGMSADDVVRLRHACNQEIRAVMKEIINSRTLPDRAAIRQIEISERYGVQSRWLLELKAHRFAGTYYSMLALGDGGPLPEQPDLERCYPVRTFELWRTILYDKGYPELAGCALSPFENELITCCSGKLCLADIEKRLYSQFGQYYSERQALRQKMLTTLQDFNKKYWVSFYTLDFECQTKNDRNDSHVGNDGKDRG